MGSEIQPISSGKTKTHFPNATLKECLIALCEFVPNRFHAGARNAYFTAQQHVKPYNHGWATVDLETTSKTGEWGAALHIRTALEALCISACWDFASGYDFTSLEHEPAHAYVASFTPTGEFPSFSATGKDIPEAFARAVCMKLQSAT
jgi:hypothetical protein